MSAALGATAELIPDNVADPRQVKGESAQTLFFELFDTVGQIAANATAQYEQLAFELRKLRIEVEALRNAGRLIPRRPRLVDGVDGDSFHHVSSSRRD